MAHLCLQCEVHTVTSNVCVMGSPGPADASQAECPPHGSFVCVCKVTRWWRSSAEEETQECLLFLLSNFTW